MIAAIRKTIIESAHYLKKPFSWPIQSENIKILK